MDHRIADRRRVVREDAARRRVRWTIAALAAAVVVGLGAWVLQSPLLAVERIDVSGVHQTDVDRALDAVGLATGVPMVTVRASHVEDALLADPWVAVADVRVVWPDAVDIVVSEREPRIWVNGTNGWLLVGDDGVVLARTATPGTALPVVELVEPSPARPGEHIGSAAVVGAMDFLATMPPTVTLDGSETSLFAWVDGHRVRLGRPIDMAAKAAALTALLEEGVPEGATIDLLSAVRPAVVPPSVEPDDDPDSQPVVEAES